MKKQAKILVMTILSLAIVFALIGCSTSATPSPSAKPGPATSSAATNPTPVASSAAANPTPVASSAATNPTPAASSKPTSAAQVSSNIIQDIDVQIDKSRPNTSTSNKRYPFIRYAQTFIPTELGPEKFWDAGKFISSCAYYESLFDQVGVDKYIGRLVKDYKWIDDTHLTMNLYDYIYDTDGNHLTASDVVFSYDILAASGFARSWKFVDSYAVDGDFTVKFTFKQPLDLNAFKDLFVDPFIVTKKAYNDNGKMVNRPVGTGPYKVTNYVTGSNIVFEATDKYWQKPELTNPLARANVQKVQIDYIADAAMQMVALEGGTSAYTKLSATDLKRFMAGGDLAGKFNLYKYYSTDAFDIVPSQGPDSIMKDINMRLAVFYAIDSKGMIKALGEQLFNGCAVDASRATADYQSDWDKWQSYQTEFSLDKAMQYLKKANYNGQTVKIIVEEHPTKKQIAQLLQGMLQAVGIKSEIKVYAKALMDTQLADSKGWDLYMGSGNDPSYVISRENMAFSKDFGKAKGYPTNFLVDDKFQSMLDKCSSKTGYSIQCTSDVLKYILDNAIAYGVAYAAEITAYDKHFASFKYKWGANKIVITASDYYLD